MASISLPPQPQSPSTFPQHLGTPEQSPSGHSRRNLSMSAPLPNPPFVFPTREPDDANSAAPETRSSGPPPLPAFSFQPGSGHASQPSLTTPPPNPNRMSGHRRRPSEFIGGEQLVTPPATEISQNVEETPPPAPAKLPAPGPGFGAGGPGRRRHAHRRSAAVSSVDLTQIQNALGKPAPSGSSPTNPAETNQKSSDQVNETARPISVNLGRPTPPASPQILIDGKPPSPSQTDFGAPPDSPKDAPEPAHSLEEDISKGSPSLDTIRPSNAGRSETDPAPQNEPPPAIPRSKPRPKTADASLFLSFGGNGEGGSSPAKRPLSAASHSRFRKSLSSGILEAALRKHEGSTDDVHFTDSSRHSSSDDGESDTSIDDAHGSVEALGSKEGSKTKKRQKKVRSWADALLTRTKSKGKKRQSKKVSSSKEIPPPILTRTNSDVGSGLDVDFDDDNTVVLRTPTHPAAPESQEESHPSPTLEDSWKPRSFYEQNAGPQPDGLSPIIDLDAALGPFNTPSARADRAESGFSAATKRMYSGGRRGEFVGPEMRYHRRAESAPEMPPFDRSFLNNNRLTSSSALENPDVFYEEDEDAFLAATTESPKKSNDRPRTQPAKFVMDNDNKLGEGKASLDTITRQPVGQEPEAQPSKVEVQKGEPAEVPERIASSRRDSDKPVEEAGSTAAGPIQHAKNPFSSKPRTPVEAVRQEGWYHRAPAPPSPDISPRFLPTDQRPVTSPIDLPPNIPHFSLQGGSLSNSSFPSPDLTGSPSEPPRSITTSSTNDRKFSNPMHNPYMDYPHASVEDVPSLTSSASTMTNTLNRFSANFFPRRSSNERSASFSAAVHRRTSQANAAKRSSFASLSKLVVGPHAERSKLSHEEKPPSDEPERAKKKGRRINRLMHFWRTKDKDRPHGRMTQDERSS